MKRIYKLFALLPILSVLILTACSNEEEVMQNNTAFEGYVFNVNAYITDGTRATGDTAIKTGWEQGNAIYCIVDNDAANILSLVYDTLARTWDTKPLENAPSFAASGSLKAVYADVLTYDQTKGVRTKGDIIITEVGTYTKSGNVIQFDLPMNNRPVMKFTILGVPDAFPCIKDFRECSYLDFSTMKFTDEGKFGLSNREQAIAYTKDAQGRTTGKKINGAYNYYGYFDDGVTGNFSLATENVSSFWVNNTHACSSLVKGTQYIVKGPNVDASLWTSEVQVIPVAKVNAMTVCAGSVVRLDSLFTYQYGNPKSEPYQVTSSNMTAATPISEQSDKTWLLKTVENEDDRGSSQITITTASASAQFNITVDTRKVVNGIKGLSFKVDSIIKRIVMDNPTNAFAYCADEFFKGTNFAYTSDNTTLATISSGIVTMKEKGTVIITAKNNDNNLQFSFKINIQDIDAYVTATWGTSAYKTEVSNSHGKGVTFTLTNGLGRNVYGMKLSGSTLSDVKEITANSIQVEYVTGTKSEEHAITEFFQVGSSYTAKTNVLKAGEKGTGYYDLDGTDLTWNRNSKATIKYTFNGVQYIKKDIPSQNATPE